MKRAKHGLSHYKLLSCNPGFLVPCALVEVLPGDTFQMASSALIRLAPLVAPVMHPFHARIHHWFVPHRLVWSNWQDFITGGPDGLNASVFPTITFAANGVSVSSLADYLGVTPANTNPIKVSALPFRGYALIWNEWYRDQDLQSKLTISTADGNDTTTNTGLQSVAWEKDYFTTARPWTQKGPTVTIPLEGNAPVRTATATGNAPSVIGAAGTPIVLGPSGAIVVTTGTAGVPPTNQPLYADLSGVSAADINSLRLAFALQRYEEARARYGSRYTEYLRYLGVRSSDARLQRPEYLGGGKQTVQFSEVLQTGVTTGGTVGGVGNLAGHGIGAMRSNRFRRFFEEHGYIFSFISLMPKSMYAQGIRRTLLRLVKEDFWQRELQHIGQQIVWNAEVYGDTATPTGTFGYQDRYDEYRRMESGIAGQFRTSLLNFWHMARIFGSQPVLNASFVQGNPTNRIFADQTGDDNIYAMVSHSIQARRLVAPVGNSFIK